MIDSGASFYGLVNFFLYFSVISYFFPPLAYDLRFSGDEKHRNKNVWPYSYTKRNITAALENKVGITTAAKENGGMHHKSTTLIPHLSGKSGTGHCPLQVLPHYNESG